MWSGCFIVLVYQDQCDTLYILSWRENLLRSQLFLELCYEKTWAYDLLLLLTWFALNTRRRPTRAAGNLAMLSASECWRDCCLLLVHFILARDTCLLKCVCLLTLWLLSWSSFWLGCPHAVCLCSLGLVPFFLCCFFCFLGFKKKLFLMFESSWSISY